MLFALKIDVDTYRGMKEGLPRLLDILKARAIKGTVFVSMGPDHSGRAIRRVFTRPGFLGKMLRTRAVALYGPKTVLYGTLLPGPRIAERNAEIFRRIEAEGHEAGVHGWDHVRWQDGLPRFDERTIARELGRAFEVFETITGHRPRSTAAPGWIANERSLAVQDGLDLLYSSDVRGTFPFLPRAGGRTFKTPQVPTTLPTLDEMIGEGTAGAEPQAHRSAEPRTGGLSNAKGLSGRPDQLQDELRKQVGRRKSEGAEAWINRSLVMESLLQVGERPSSPIVHTIHTEVEGLSRAALFEDLLDRLLAEGARFTRLCDVVLEIRTAGNAGVAMPRCEVADGQLPGRSGALAIQTS